MLCHIPFKYKCLDKRGSHIRHARWDASENLWLYDSGLSGQLQTTLPLHACFKYLHYHDAKCLCMSYPWSFNIQSNTNGYMMSINNNTWCTSVHISGNCLPISNSSKVQTYVNRKFWWSKWFDKAFLTTLELLEGKKLSKDSKGEIIYVDILSKFGEQLSIWVVWPHPKKLCGTTRHLILT